LRSAPVEGFRLAYDREGAGPPVVLLHGWPGDRHDYREVTPLLSASAEVVVPDLRGFGESDKHPEDPACAYSAEAQARSVAGLIAELGFGAAVIAGYDIGSRVAQTIARTSPELVRAIALAPPLPGAGDRVLTADAQREFWYQAFHQLEIADELIDGDRSAVRAYLPGHFSPLEAPRRFASAVRDALSTGTSGN
jgi:pimeloyl-ACP methyl ester carboxylesterase